MRISDWSSDVCSSDLHLAIRGVPFVAIDTAGLRETGDVVEREGIARARAAVATADIVLAMAGEDGRFEPVETQAPVIRVMSRSDLSGEPAGPDSDGIQDRKSTRLNSSH